MVTKSMVRDGGPVIEDSRAAGLHSQPAATLLGRMLQLAEQTPRSENLWHRSARMALKNVTLRPHV